MKEKIFLFALGLIGQSTGPLENNFQRESKFFKSLAFGCKPEAVHLCMKFFPVEKKYIYEPKLRASRG